MTGDSRVYVSLRKGISTVGVVRRELDRIESITGSRPIDWLYEIHDIAVAENTDGDFFDFEGFEMQISCDADHFIDFVCENYPAEIRH